MGALNDILGAAVKAGKKHMSYVVVITDLGKDKLEKPGVSIYQWRILNFLAENGPSPVRDISAGTDMPEEKVRATCKTMADDGFIMKRNTGGGD
jgi:DNA-binding MarR family transcriptional regulator